MCVGHEGPTHSSGYRRSEGLHTERKDYRLTDEWKDKSKKLRLDHRYCDRCGRLFDVEDLTVHHINPLDIYRPVNEVPDSMYRILCNPCHSFEQPNGFKLDYMQKGTYLAEIANCEFSDESATVTMILTASRRKYGFEEKYLVKKVFLQDDAQLDEFFTAVFGHSEYWLPGWKTIKYTHKKLIIIVGYKSSIQYQAYNYE